MSIKNYKCKIFFIIISLLIASVFSCKKNNPTEMDYPLSDELKLNNKNIKIIPVNHASFGLKIMDIMILVDPVGEKKLYETLEKPDLILLTDIHHDHLNIETIDNLKKESTILIGSVGVQEKIKQIKVVRNGETYKYKDITIKATPMYNLNKDRLKYHSKGRGNGYIISDGTFNLYISGDTEDIPEMRSLENIDVAIVCMNLPYTMTVEQAASAVLEFRPKFVYPYHYRGKGGFSDINKFKELVSKDKNIEVKFLKWY